MKAKAVRAKLEKRRKSWDGIPSNKRDGCKRPGSMNERKQA